MTTMPMDPMTCDGFADALMAYLEHDAPHAVRAAVEGHAAACASCAALLMDIRRIEHDAAHLPPLEPSRDLWAGIAARIETPVVTLAPRQAQRAARPWVRPALVAAGLVLVSVVGTRAVMQRGDGAAPTSAPQVAATEPSVTSAASPDGPELPADAPAAQAIEPVAPQPAAPAPVRATARPRATLASNAVPQYRSGSWAAVDSLYGAEIGRLRRIAAERKQVLDPATVAVLEKNIAIIDQAIRESRAAIARDPNSALLNEHVNRMLDQKVELLRAMTALPSRS